MDDEYEEEMYEEEAYREPEPPQLAPGEAPRIEWEGPPPESGRSGEVKVTIPAIPGAGINRTVIRARGNATSAAKSVARQATKILNSSAVQAVLPPQAKMALKAARGLAKVVPKKWKKFLSW